MATKSPAKPAAKSASTAVAKRASSNVVAIQDALKAQVAGMGERLGAATGISINTKAKRFTFPDGRKDDGPVELVIVDFIRHNTFYDAPYDEKNPIPPACFSLNQVIANMVPSKNSPVVQAQSCKGCPMNEFGSNGNGKACTNSVLLAVLPPDADEETPIWLLKVSPTGLKSFDGYVRQVTAMTQMPPLSVVTEVSFDDSLAYPSLRFGNPRPNDNLAVHFARQEEAKKLLETEPDVSGYQSQKPAAKRAGGRR